jgi:hypothetical protein
VAAGVQPIPFDAVVRTISDLAARDAAHRWLMTIALVGVGVSHLVTSCALRCAAVAVLLRPEASVAAAGVLLLPLAWFFVEQLSGGPLVGLSERVAAGTQAVWPLAVVLSVRSLQPNPGTVRVGAGQT